MKPHIRLHCALAWPDAVGMPVYWHAFVTCDRSPWLHYPLPLSSKSWHPTAAEALRHATFSLWVRQPLTNAK